MRKLFVGAFLSILWSGLGAQITIPSLPFDVTNQTKPTAVVGLDDSGSMDSEVLLPTNDGAAWFEIGRGFHDSKGNLIFNETGSANASFKKFVYLFPNGTGAGQRIYSDSTNDHYAIPPTKAYAWARSRAFNPQYYDHTKTYLPWAPAVIDGKRRVFAAADPTAVLSSPVRGTSTMDLTKGRSASTTAGEVFRFFEGMVIPGAEIAGVSAREVGGKSWAAQSKNFTVPAGKVWEAAIPYYPATYYVPSETNCTTCVPAPDGKWLREVRIVSGEQFPSGRTYAAEMQNFANWFQYYRKRHLALSAAAGQVFTTTTGIRVGHTLFNTRQSVALFDLDSPNSSENGEALAGRIYMNPANGGTPTRLALNFIGDQFRKDAKLIESACQANSAFILTDGFANVDAVTVPSYANTWVKSAPYQTIHKGSLTDIAAYYYTTNLNTSYATGKVPTARAGSPNADLNTNLHMNTYALTLGARGTIYGVDGAMTKDPYSKPPTWPAPNSNRSPTSVDDLWHATIVGRGEMFLAGSPDELVKHFRAALKAMLVGSGSRTGVVLSSPLMTKGEGVFLTQFDSQEWTGDLTRHKVGNDGAVDRKTSIWSAAEQLSKVEPDERILVTYEGKGVPFRSDALSASYLSLLSQPAADNGDEVLEWVRGSLGEKAGFNTRASAVGDIIRGQPLYVSNKGLGYSYTGYADFVESQASRPAMLVQPTNGGVVHVFDAETGKELWGFIPRGTAHKLGVLSQEDSTHQFLADAAPVQGDVEVDGVWHTIAVGGFGAGAPGVYALDLTGGAPSDEEAAAERVLWEFPGTDMVRQERVGHVYGKPVFARTSAGWVLLVASGYNVPDGQASVFALHPLTGEVLAEIALPAGLGVAHLSALADTQHSADVTQVFAGDLKGQVFRIDLSNVKPEKWAAARIATLTSSRGDAQPITSPVELAYIDERLMLYAVTGKLLEESDVEDTSEQSAYGFFVPASGKTVARKDLTERAVAADDLAYVEAEDLPTKSSGWVIDLPSTGERGIHAPVAAYGLLTFVTNAPSAVACSSSSYLYALDLASGTGALASSFSPDEPWSRRKVADMQSNDVEVAAIGNSAYALTTTANGNVVPIKLPGGAGAVFRRVAWQEIF